MCGIIGYIGSKQVVPILIDGLRRLEYRGYDSAGVAVVRDGSIDLRRSAGKLARLEEVIATTPIDGEYGIGHTRWATHGRPTEENAHPHRDCTGRIVVVHNGIIENYLDLKQQLQKEGHKFVTETDTEIVAHLVEREMKDDGLENAVRRALLYMRGLFALVLISADDPDKIVTVRNGPPIVVGLGDGEFFVASDIPAILSHTRDVVFLGDEEMAVITRRGSSSPIIRGAAVSKKSTKVSWDPVMAEKAGYKHFMLKEIFEQPWAVKETVLGRASQESGKVFLHEIEIPDQALREVQRIVILACGTSWHAALVGEVPVRIRWPACRSRSTTARSTAIAIRSSRRTRSPSSSRSPARRRTRWRRCGKPRRKAREALPSAMSSAAWPRARPTARSTRTPGRKLASPRPKRSRRRSWRFTCWRCIWARSRGTLSPEAARPHIDGLAQLPLLIEHTLRCETITEEIAKRFYQRSDFLYLGRGLNYPIALEGALKLKEISYIHAEGYPAGEMKHGPIALIDEQMPVVTIAPDDHVFEKMIGNIQEAKARGGSVIALTTEGHESIRSLLDPSQDFLIEVPGTSSAADARADGRAAAVARVSHRDSARLRRRSAQKPG